jgi:hypothetical protein
MKVGRIPWNLSHLQGWAVRGVQPQPHTAGASAQFPLGGPLGHGSVRAGLASGKIQCDHVKVNSNFVWTGLDLVLNKINEDTT